MRRSSMQAYAHNINLEKINRILEHFHQKNVNISDIGTKSDSMYQDWKDFYQIDNQHKYKSVASYIKKRLNKDVTKGEKAIDAFQQTPKSELRFLAVTNDQCVFSFTIQDAKRFTYNDAIWLSIHVFPEVILFNPYSLKSFICNQDGFHFYL
jgi:predicted AlkP superfamily pyrophosphatase or phosphodiesterase